MSITRNHIEIMEKLLNFYRNQNIPKILKFYIKNFRFRIHSNKN